MLHQQSLTVTWESLLHKNQCKPGQSLPLSELKAVTAVTTRNRNRLYSCGL
jgi:hypothetical protein